MYRVKYNGYTVIFASEALAHTLYDSSVSVALGNFDGVHIAHKELLNCAINMKKNRACDLVGAWTFSCNPLGYFTENPPRAIYSLEKKAEILLLYGMDFVVLADFGFFKDMPCEDFCEYLKNDIGARCVVCGYNYRFGSRAKGNPEYLMAAFGENNTAVVGEIDYEGLPVSSTRIRGLIESGDIRSANTLLGRPFSITGEVVSGKKLGRSLGFPTANQYFGDGSLVPKCGIYATRCNIDGITYIGVTNIGVRPTVENSQTVNAETYILNFSGDIYGKKIEIEFIEYLREEKRFSSLDELKKAISRDAETAKDVATL